jgi:hypothetical protein
MRIRTFEAGEAQTLLDLWRLGDATPSVTDTVADVERVAANEHARCLVAEGDGAAHRPLGRPTGHRARRKGPPSGGKLLEGRRLRSRFADHEIRPQPEQRIDSAL